MAMSDPRTAARPPGPSDGDVVVTNLSRIGQGCTIRQVPGLAQFRAPGLEQAFRLVRAFARSRGVDVWYSENGVCRIVESFRRASPVTAVDGEPTV
jgi:hypothetical protein